MIKTVNYNIKDINKKIVLIADIHYSSKKQVKLLNNVLDKIKKLNPDYICITGDLIDDNYFDDQELLYNWLYKLGKICKVLYITGNHEYYGKNRDYFLDEKVMNKISSINNLIYLNNEVYKENDINFIGINTPIDCYKNNNNSINRFIKFMNGLKIKLNDNYNIMLCHSPVSLIKGYESINILKKIDLVFCGHMHKGLTPEILKPLLKGQGIISPFKNIGFKYSYGIHKIGKTLFIITSGISILSKRSKLNMFDFLFCKEISYIKKGKN